MFALGKPSEKGINDGKDPHKLLSLSCRRCRDSCRMELWKENQCLQMQIDDQFLSYDYKWVVMIIFKIVMM
jgi:hypothetical protein